MLLEEKGANVHDRDREGHSGRVIVYFFLLYQQFLFYYTNSGLRQSFRVSIPITAQCIQTQLMAHGSSEKYLQIMGRSLYVRLLIHAVIYITKCQRASKCFSFMPSSYGHLSVSDCSTIPEKNWQLDVRGTSHLHMPATCWEVLVRTGFESRWRQISQ